LKIGTSYDGDIAIDDLVYTTTSCQATGGNATIAPLQVGDLKCDFDSNTFCKWENDQAAEFRWTLNKGPTGTIFTGPSFDQ
jgi:hypothetical protein